MTRDDELRKLITVTHGNFFKVYFKFPATLGSYSFLHLS